MMQDHHLFEYAVIRMVPKVEREEFLNVGVILYCGATRFLKTLTIVNQEKLYTVFPESDLDDIHTRLQSFEKICIGNLEGGAISQMPLASRFRWLTAAKSTIIQTSPVHPGWCRDPEADLRKLFEKLVL